MIPYNEEHIEAEEKKYADLRAALISQLNLESQAKYKKLEELIGEIEKLELPFWLAVLAPVSSKASPRTPVEYSAIIYHNIHSFGTRGYMYISDFFLRELLARIVTSFSVMYLKQSEGHVIKAFWRVIDDTWRYVAGEKTPHEQSFREKAYEYFNKKMGLNLNPNKND